MTYKYFVLFFFFIPLSRAEMVFTYQPNEGGEALTCTHRQIQDLPDWDITCGPKGEKKFSAHVIIRRYQREETPRQSLEILYWVSEPGKKPKDSHIFHTSSFIIRQKEKSEFAGGSFSQGVENDYASLVLDLVEKP